jgi:hypothetical protein
VAEESEMNESLSPWKILILPVVGSIVLIVLFYFLKILRWLLLAIITVSSFSSMAFVTYPFWHHIMQLTPPESRGRTIGLPSRVAACFGENRLPTAVPLAMLGSLFAICMWLATNNWVITNLIALCLGVTSIVSLQLPNAMLATLLLSIFWAYDIFWVFISPLIFPKNVMETVAVGVSQLELPMVFKIPRFLAFLQSATLDQWPPFIPNFFAIFGYFEQLLQQYDSAGFIMLGLGDIILPGLALNFFFRRDEFLAFEEQDERDQQLQRQDLENDPLEEIEDLEASEPQILQFENARQSPSTPSRSPFLNNLSFKPRFKLTYYMVAQIGYALGLVLTFFMLVLLKRGQPALLYLVPCTLIPPFILAWSRGQFLWLWRSIVGVEQVEDSLSQASDEAENQYSTLPEENEI